VTTTDDTGTTGVPDASQTRAGPRRFGGQVDRLAELEEERRYLLGSLKDLERELAAGDVDDEDYTTLKNGYTVRAATVLREIESGRRALAPKRQRNLKRTIAIWVLAAVMAGGIGVALASAFGERGVNDEITGRSLGDDTRTTLAQARAALNRGDFARANTLYVRADRAEIERGNDNAEARAHVGWTFALLARSEATDDGIAEEPLSIARLALDQAIAMDATYADPYCYAAIVEFNFLGDADAALPYVEQCEALDPPADIRGLVESFAQEIREAAAE
jgi:tetratricopeptide (TPR) repeat protein